MAFYCELPNERICDIGWERLTCTEQWLEDQIREIQGYSREQRVRLGKECVNDVIRFLANMYKNDEAGTDSYLSLYLFAVGIACLNRTSATQAWKDEVVEVFHVLPEALENVIRPFDNGNPFTYQTVVATMAIFGTDAVRPIGSRYLQLCICIACADTPNVAAFDWIRKIHREYLLLLDRWNHALYAAALGGDRSEMTVEDDYQNEKPILPLREYRRQQRAAERKKRQAKESEAERRKQAYAERHERMQREAEEKEQRIQNAQAEYEAAMAQWRNQTEKAERDRKRALEQRLKQEEKNLRDEATQRRNAAVRENNRIIAEQEKLRGRDGGGERVEPADPGHCAVGGAGPVVVSPGGAGVLGRHFVFAGAGPHHPASAREKRAGRGAEEPPTACWRLLCSPPARRSRRPPRRPARTCSPPSPRPRPAVSPASASEGPL